VIGRRSASIALAAAIVGGPHAFAQTARLYRIGWPASVAVRQWPPYQAFVGAMRELGWIEGAHYVVEEASYDGRPERVATAVAEAVARKPDLLVGSGTPPMPALIAATTTIPIVMFAVGDPLGQRFVADLARPGGNVTGISSLDHGLLGKQFELLVEAAPRARRIGVAFNPDIATHRVGWREVEEGARRLGVVAVPVTLRSVAEMDGVVETLQRERVDAVQFFIQPFLNTGRAEGLSATALKQRWPTAIGTPEHVHAGILLTYGWRNEDLLRRLAYYIDRVLKGAPPGSLPVEYPTRFYLSLNQKTARALGLTLPRSLLLRADELVE
jgi:putative ABC transport system substrate-binding protein